jgi:glucose/arabinose dehydrogenase
MCSQATAMRDRLTRAARVALLAVLALGCGRDSGGAATPGVATHRDPTQLDHIRLPPGFRIAVYADGLDDARSLALSPAGTVFVGSRRQGAVYAVPDRDRDGRPEAVQTIARGLDTPNGIAWRDGDLYVVEPTRVLRYDDVESHLGKPSQPSGPKRA